MNCRVLYSVLPALVIFLASCEGSSSRPPVQTVERSPEKETLAAVNRQLAAKDKDIIEAFIRRKGWTMEADSEGFYRMLLQRGKGAVITANSTVELRCDVYLLDGTPCYLQQTRTFQLNSTAEIAGLHKGLLNLHGGDKVRFIFPPHMAYGLPGDRDKIPPRAIVRMEVEIISPPAP